MIVVMFFIVDALVLFLFGLLLAPDREDAIGDTDLDILLFEAGQFGGDLNLLVGFTVLAEERNVSRAAARLFLSQPAVSRALQRLRDMFHDDLLMRTAAGYEPTLQGQRLIEELKVFLPRLDRLLGGSAFDPEVEQARFRIAATEHAASIVAPVSKGERPRCFSSSIARLRAVA